MVHQVMLAQLPGASLLEQTIRLLVTIVAALVALAGTAQALRIHEFAEARDLILRRLRRIPG